MSLHSRLAHEVSGPEGASDFVQHGYTQPGRHLVGSNESLISAAWILSLVQQLETSPDLLRIPGLQARVPQTLLWFQSAQIWHSCDVWKGIDTFPNASSQEFAWLICLIHQSINYFIVINSNNISVWATQPYIESVEVHQWCRNHWYW